MMAPVLAMVCGALAQTATQAPIELSGTEGPIFPNDHAFLSRRQ